MVVVGRRGCQGGLVGGECAVATAVASVVVRAVASVVVVVVVVVVVGGVGLTLWMVRASSRIVRCVLSRSRRLVSCLGLVNIIVMHTQWLPTFI
eukprot:COSAG06_NODE_462_length_15394_cov_16.361164_19_plen_94_part_00